MNGETMLDLNNLKLGVADEKKAIALAHLRREWDETDSNTDLNSVKEWYGHLSRSHVSTRTLAL
jgi:hypothetical protein